MDRNKEINKIKDKIIDYYNPEKVILFGSSTYTYTHPDSDIDIFVVAKTDKSQSERHRVVDKVFIDRKFALDVLVYTPEEIEDRINKGDSFVKDIIEGGKILYAKR